MKLSKYLLIQVAIFYLLFLKTSVLFSCDGPLIAERVEEGWRYHQSFTFTLEYEIEGNPRQTNVDLETEHHAMAHTLRTLNTAGEKKTCLVSFTPLILKEKTLEKSEAVYLTEGPLHEFNPPESKKKFGFLYPELVFVSGFEEPKKPSHKNTYDFVSYRDEVAPKAFSTFHAVVLRNEKSLTFPFALSLIQKNYINLLYLKERLKFRYPESPTPSCFFPGDYQRLHQAVKETKDKLENKPKEVEVFFNEVNTLLSYGDTDTLKITVDKDGPSVKKVVQVIKELTENEKMNHYACAEQSALNFLCDKRIREYLRSALNIEAPNVLSIVINIHCSHTPCCSCATSLAREIEKDGILHFLFDSKPIFLVASTQNHYKRPRDKGMIPYKDTNFLGKIKPTSTSVELEVDRLKGDMKRPLKFKITQPVRAMAKNIESILAPSPYYYPVILLHFVEAQNQFRVAEEDIQDMLKEHVEEFLKLGKQKDRVEEDKTEKDENIGLASMADT